MLQQTRVAAAIPYYERFLERFPTVEALAGAEEQAVLAAWSGLGYYSRARNMQKAARSIGSREFPSEYERIRTLHGIGDYTAAAIASLAFGLPHAVVDGNVLRVLSRYTNDAGDIGSAATKRRLGEVAQSMLDAARPGEFNQALMELGATVCLPRNPQCLMCPVAAGCEARRQGTQRELPVKLRKTAPVSIERTLLLVRRGERLLLRQRADNETRMAGFWEIPEREHLPCATEGEALGEFRHSITFHRFRFLVREGVDVRRVPKAFQWMERPELDRVPLTTVTRKALRVAGL